MLFHEMLQSERTEYVLSKNKMCNEEKIITNFVPFNTYLGAELCFVFS